jgi:hypothetical protein
MMLNDMPAGCQNSVNVDAWDSCLIALEAWSLSSYGLLGPWTNGINTVVMN